MGTASRAGMVSGVCSGFSGGVSGGTLSRTTQDGLGTLVGGNPALNLPQYIQGLIL